MSTGNYREKVKTSAACQVLMWLKQIKNHKAKKVKEHVMVSYLLCVHRCEYTNPNQRKQWFLNSLCRCHRARISDVFLHQPRFICSHTSNFRLATHYRNKMAQGKCGARKEGKGKTDRGNCNRSCQEVIVTAVWSRFHERTSLWGAKMGGGPPLSQ